MIINGNNDNNNIVITVTMAAKTLVNLQGENYKA